MDEKAAALRVIDAKIAQVEREFADYQTVMQQFQLLQMSLNALRQTRAVLIADDAATPPPPPQPLAPPKAETIQIDLEAEARLTIGSISSLIVETLKDARRPLQLRMVLNAIRQKGKPELGYRALSSVMSQCLARGLVRRVGPGLYDYAGTEKGESSTETEE
jgi:hypothetical protein